MDASRYAAHDASRRALRERLQLARAAARLSQLALSLRLDVSQRHISCVESGRAQQSRELLVAWLDALGAPLGVPSFFTMLTTFGTPQDITLASLRVEHMFAADALTADTLRAHVHSDG